MGSTPYSSYSRLAPTPTPVSPSSKSPLSPHRQPIPPSPSSLSQSTATSRLPTTTNTTTQASRTRTSKASSLHIPTMPRFHPANYQLRHSGSSTSNNSTRPTATANNPQTASLSPRSPSSPHSPGQATVQARPMSPLSQFQSNHHSHNHHHQQQQQQQNFEAQRQLHLYQRDLLAAAGRAALKSPRQKPMSPQLMPIGSPGPVTPLALEEDVSQQHQQQQQQGDYLACRGMMAPGGTGSAKA